MTQKAELTHTPIDSIPSICETVRNSFLSHKTRNVEFRLKQLRKLYWALEDNQQAILDACKSDLGKPNFETYLVEFAWLKNDIVFMSDNLEKWVKDEAAPDIPLTNYPFNARIRKDPLGTVLVLGAYNFPLQLSMGPCIGAIAAGCTVVLKPSESSPAAANVMEKIFKEALDPSCYTVVQGAVPESSKLLEQKWDKIFYTGGAAVGKIIAKKAAETLTPVTLELGGKNPAIVTAHADPRLAARRLLWAKLHNAGQVCVSQNYILVDKTILPQLIAELKNAMTSFFPNGIKDSPDYGRIVNKRQFQKLKKMLDESKGRILMGGTMDDESFGPLIPVLPVESLDEAIDAANRVDATPLGVYPFGTKAETDKILDQTRSGGASVNDGYFHASMPTLAFGGVGTSGQGAYRGKASFDVFTHRRSVTTTPSWLEGMLDIRYPPYTAAKQKKFENMQSRPANFDRNGNVKLSVMGVLSYILGLGTKSASSGALRWFIVLAVAYGARQYQLRSKL